MRSIDVEEGDGDIYAYQGQWDDEQGEHGLGKRTRTDEDSTVVYEGEFCGGEFVYGTQTYKGGTMDGTVRQGEFVDEMLQGRGKTTYSDGTVYEGEYLDSLPDGQGKMTLPDGTYYEGGWDSGHRLDADGWVLSRSRVLELVAAAR